MKAIKNQNRTSMKQMVILSFMLLFLCSAVSNASDNTAKNPVEQKTTVSTTLTAGELNSEMLTVENTMIFSFSIQKSDYVRFSIFNAKGQEINIMVDENMNAGSFSADLGQLNLGEGTYYYRLVVGASKEVRKLNVIY
ncbi:MAG: T9SS type A sorting domain-containing protein [Ignavibacteria bacterium]|nr:T9SS type A sorting domain-containing protein [Ignavibacteria bacterium]